MNVVVRFTDLGESLGRLRHDFRVEAQVLNGLRPGERVVLYPASDLADGARVVERKAGS